MSFWQKIIQYRWDRIESAISRKTAQDVRQALRTPARNFDDLLALLSPAAADFLEMMGGSLPPMQAYTSGKLRIEGDIMKSQLIEKLFRFAS